MLRFLLNLTIIFLDESETTSRLITDRSPFERKDEVLEMTKLKNKELDESIGFSRQMTVLIQKATTIRNIMAP